jgi:hypothetical protein
MIVPVQHPRSYKEIMEKAPNEFKEYAQCLDWYG